MENEKIQNVTREIEKNTRLQLKNVWDLKCKTKASNFTADKERPYQQSNEKEQIKLIAKYLKEIFCKDAEPIADLISTTPMKIMFMKIEIKLAARKLRTTKVLEKTESLPR